MQAAPRATGEKRAAPMARPERLSKARSQQPSGLRPSVFYPLLGFACLAVALVSFALLANPAEIVRDRLVSHVKAHLDRDLTVSGASLTYFPFGVLLRDVELSSSSDAPGPGLVRAAAVDVRVSLLSLLRQRVAVSSVTMMKPEINLSIDADGRRNWDFASTHSSQRRLIRFAQLAPRFGFGKDLPQDLMDDRARGGDAVRVMALGLAMPEAALDIRVQDGSVRFSDERSGTKKQVTNVTVEVGLNGLERQAQLSGSFKWSDEPVSLQASLEIHDVASPQADVRLKGRALEAAYKGRLGLASGLELDGRLTASAPSADALVQWVKGAELRTASPGADAAIDGRVKLSGTVLELADASITAHGTSANGSVSVDVSGPKPLVRADLKLTELDFGRARKPSSSGAAGLPPLIPKTAADKARSIDDLLKRPEDLSAKAPVVPPESGHGEQTTPPLDLSILRLADLDGRFDIGKLRWRDVEVGSLRLVTTISEGKLTANATEAHLYGGLGKGVLGVAPKGDGAIVNLEATIDGVATQKMLKGLWDFDWLDGRGQLALGLSGEGASEQQIVDGLQGRAEIKVADGALVGWDLTQMLRGLRQGTLPSTDRHSSARTDFGDLTGSFVIADGVARNEDLKVTGRSINVSGGGAIAYRDRSIDYTVRPRLSEAPGGLEDVAIPVRIHGTWEKPVLSPDLDSVLKDPRTAAKVQQLGRQLRSGNVDEALKSVLGEGPEAEKKAEKAKSFLKRFLKQ